MISQLRAKIPFHRRGKGTRHFHMTRAQAAAAVRTWTIRQKNGGGGSRPRLNTNKQRQRQSSGVLEVGGAEEREWKFFLQEQEMYRTPEDLLRASNSSVEPGNKVVFLKFRFCFAT